MRIVDGNIFESMRLILPEHREVMKRDALEAKKQEPPILDESALAEIEYVLQEAIEYQLPVAATLFGLYEDDVLVGVPYPRNGGIALRIGDDVQQIDMQRLVRITFAD